MSLREIWLIFHEPQVLLIINILRWNLEYGHLLKRLSVKEGQAKARKQGAWEGRVDNNEGGEVHSFLNMIILISNLII